MNPRIIKKVVNFQLVLLLITGSFALWVPTAVYSVEKPIEMTSSKAGQITLKEVASDENDTIRWQLSLKKAASMEVNHIEAAVEISSGDILKVSDIKSESQLQVNGEKRYVLTEDSKEEGEITFEVVTTGLPSVTDYELQLTPIVVFGDGTLPFLDQKRVKFSFSTKTMAASSSETIEESEVATEESQSAEANDTTAGSKVEESATSTNEIVQNDQLTQKVTRAILGTGNPTVPKGAIKLDGMFSTVGWDREKGSAITDFSGIIAQGPTDQNNGMPYDEITLTGKQRAIGVWSKGKYQLDFSEDFHGRTYVNFGPGDLNADGFAFVMHNDENQDQALTTANHASDGQNLGVYGGTNAYRPSLGQPLRLPEYHAIKNSMAVEFDLFANTSGDAIYDKQDNAQSTPHISWNLPGDTSFTYRSNNIFNDELWSDGSKAKIFHKNLQLLNGFVGDNVRDGTWYEFRFDFIKESLDFSYYLVNPVTGAQTPKVTIPWATLSSEKGLNLAQNGNKAYWGFTGANGEASGQTKFVFTQVPVAFDAQLQNDVESEAHSVVDRDNVENYSPGMPAAIYGNEVRMRSDFVLQAESEAGYAIDTWTTKLDPGLYDLSNGITEVKAILNEEEMIGCGHVEDDGKVTVTFEDPINVPKPTTSAPQTLHLTYTAQLKREGEITKTVFESQVSGREIGNNTAANFRGEDAFYWVIPKPQNPTVLSWRDPLVETEKTDVTKDPSEVTAGYEDVFFWQDLDEDDQLKFYLKKGDEIVFSSPWFTSRGAAGFTEHDFTIPSQYLGYGENKFVVEAYRQGDSGEVKEAATLNLTVTVTGSLVFETYPENLSWRGRKVGESKGLLSRDAGNSMTLSVLDSREKADDWELYVEAEILDETMPFDFVFKDSLQDEPKVITTDKLLIMEKKDSAADFRYTKSWDETSGILLDSKEYLHVGSEEYSGKVNLTWTLSHTAEVN